MKHSPLVAQKEGQKGEEQIRTTPTPHMKPQTHNKEELQQTNRLEMVNRKTTEEHKLISLARNLALNFDAASN